MFLLILLHDLSFDEEACVGVDGVDIDGDDFAEGSWGDGGGVELYGDLSSFSWLDAFGGVGGGGASASCLYMVDKEWLIAGVCDVEGVCLDLIASDPSEVVRLLVELCSWPFVRLLYGNGDVVYLRLAG